MHREIAELFMYGDLDKNSILYRLGEIFEAIDSGSYNRQQVIREVKVQLKRLLVLATDYGFDKNLWHNYIAFFLLMNENPFSLVCEKSAVSEGTVTSIVKEDFAHIRRIFLYDFSAVEQALGVNCFSILSHYQAVKKSKKIYNWNVSEKVQALSQKLEAAADDDAFYQAVTGFYHDYGVGLFGLNKAFRVEVTPEGGIRFVAINNMDVVTLDDLVGYERQKKKLIENTEAYVSGVRANNVLLYGDSGTGKSTSIKAIINQYYDRGLRMIEIYKHQFKYLSAIISTVKNRNYKFIIYMDDLSFEDNQQAAPHQGDVERQERPHHAGGYPSFRHGGGKALPRQPFWYHYRLFQAHAQGVRQHRGHAGKKSRRAHGRSDPAQRSRQMGTVTRRRFGTHRAAVCRLSGLSAGKKRSIQQSIKQSKQSIKKHLLCCHA